MDPLEWFIGGFLFTLGGLVALILIGLIVSVISGE